MSVVNKYLKIAKNAVIKPPTDIEKKIMDRIYNLSKSDKLLLDEKFLDYLRKSNSRLYLLCEKIRNSPGKVVALGSIAVLIVIFLIIELRNYRNRLDVKGSDVSKR